VSGVVTAAIGRALRRRRRNRRGRQGQEAGNELRQIKTGFEFRVPSFELKIVGSQSELETRNSELETRLPNRRPAAALIRRAGCVEDELHAVTVFERGRTLNHLAAFAKGRNYRG
jgi:hypothetical protein